MGGPEFIPNTENKKKTKTSSPPDADTGEFPYAGETQEIRTNASQYWKLQVPDSVPLVGRKTVRNKFLRALRDPGSGTISGQYRSNTHPKAPLNPHLTFQRYV